MKRCQGTRLSTPLQPAPAASPFDFSGCVTCSDPPIVRYHSYKPSQPLPPAPLMSPRSCIALLAAAVLCSPALADESPKTPPQFAGLKYRSIGPAAGGRTTRAVGVPGDPLTYYVAAAAGGIWKSTDGGISFKPIFDDQPVSSIGSLAIAPSDPNVVYVGSGEANIRGN